MPRINAIHWKILECIFKMAGFVFERQHGDHRTYSMAGCLRPVIIPTYNEIGIDIIQSNMRTAKMTREKYFEYLVKCK